MMLQQLLRLGGWLLVLTLLGVSGVWQHAIGAGVFEDSGQELSNATSSSVTLGDVDGDGDLDALVTNRTGSDQVWLNQGTGVFVDSGQTLGMGGLNVALGDLDDDDNLDAFIVTNAFNDSNQVWLNQGGSQQGTFVRNGQIIGNALGRAVRLGDVDSDGDLDAFVVRGSSQPDQVWLNDGQGQFSNSGQSLGTADSFGVVLGDMDGDGDLDALVATSTDGQVWRNQSDLGGAMLGVFEDTGQSVGPGGASVALGDVDGDGDLDVFIVTNSANQVWLNDSQGQFSDSGQRLGQALSQDVALGDVDGDGDLDAFVANFDAPNRVWLNETPPPPVVNPEDWQVQFVDVRGVTGLQTSLSLDAHGFPHISYVQFDSREYNLWYVRWDGMRWLREQVDTSPFIGRNTVLALDTSGRPHIAYLVSSSPSTMGVRDLRYARRVNEQWQIQTVERDVRRYVSLTLDSNDNPHISFDTSDRGIRLNYAFWDGAEWQIEGVRTFMSGSGFSSLSLDANDIPHISYMDSELRFARRNGMDDWHVETVDMDAIGGFSSLALDASNTPHISYCTRGTDGTRQIRYARRTGNPWVIQMVAVVPENSCLEQTSLGLDSAGTPHVSYVLSSDTDLSLQYARLDGDVWRMETLDNSGKVGAFNSLALDANNTPHISYHAQDYGDLRYITRAPNWRIQTVDDSGTVQAPSLRVRNATPTISYYNQTNGQGQLTVWDEGWGFDAVAAVNTPVSQTSLALGSPLTHLSFYDADNRRLLYATGDGSTVTPYIVDDDGDVGQYNHLRLVADDPEALVRIAYWDATNFQVKLARLGGSNPIPQLLTNTAGPVLNIDSGHLAAPVLLNANIGISYYDGVSGDLRLAIWDAGRATWTDGPVDGLNADVGRLNALQTDFTDGLPVVAYYDTTNRALKYAYRDHATGWQIEVAVPEVGVVTSLALELGFNSRLRPRLAFTVDNALHVATRSDGPWQVETVVDGTTPLGNVALALDTRPHLAYTDGSLHYAARTATIDASTTAPLRSFYNPLQPCLVNQLTGAPSASRQVADAPAVIAANGGLDDLAIFNGLQSLFETSPGGRFFIDLYRQHGSEMGRLGLNDPQLLLDAYGTLQNFLPGLEALVTGRGDEILVTQEMMDDAFDIWTRLTAAGSSQLAEAINTQLARTNNLQDFVGMSFAGWAEALGVAPPLCNGDIDNNGQVTPADALLDLQCFLDLSGCTAEVRGRASTQGDITQDGQLTAADAQCVLQRFFDVVVTDHCACFLE